MHEEANFDSEYMIRELKRIGVKLTEDDLSEILMYDTFFKFIRGELNTKKGDN